MQKSFDKPQMDQIVNHILQLKQKHHITKWDVDGANPEVIREVKEKDGWFIIISRIDIYYNS